MNIIEKIKAGHPYEEIIFDNGEYSITPTIRLLPEPQPGEILTKEWVRYYVEIGTPMQARRLDRDWGPAQIHFGGSFSTLQYRLPLPKKLRNKRPDELPYIFQTKTNQLALVREDITSSCIDMWAEEKESYTTDGITYHSFQTEDES